MSLVGIALVVWALFVAAFLTGWGRHFRALRAAHRIDEELYASGLDDRSSDDPC